MSICGYLLRLLRNIDYLNNLEMIEQTYSFKKKQLILKVEGPHNHNPLKYEQQLNATIK